MTEVVLSIRNLSVAPAEGRTSPVLRDVSLDVKAGEIVGVAGASGSGKSTLAYAALGLTKPGLEITGGELLLHGRDVFGMTDREQRRLRGDKIALITQNPRRALHPMLPIGRQIESVRAAHRGPADTDEPGFAIASLERVGINDPERRSRAFSHELSGGMAQRALIAMALAGEPELVVADEPTSGLDVTVQAQFLDWLWQRAKQRELCLLLATQEQGILANYCDRVVELQDGAVVLDLDYRDYVERCDRPNRRFRQPPTDKATGESIAEIAGLERHYPLRGSDKRVHAVGGVTLRFAAGETLALIGESGSGKTTVGRCLAGLETPSSGTIRFRGQAIDRYSRRELSSQLQYVRQDPFDSFDPRWTIGRSVAEALRLHAGLRGGAAADAANVLLERVGCPAEIGKRKPAEVSAGVLQKANIARALAVEPAMLVLDEPTAVLAPADRDDLLRLLATLNADRSLTVLLISHDLSSVAAISDTLAVMYLGQIVETGPTDKLFDAPAHPYTRALLAAHLDVDPGVRHPERENCEHLSGDIPSPIDLPSGCFLASRCGQALPRCATERQTIEVLDDGHAVRCWRVMERTDTALPHAE